MCKEISIFRDIEVDKKMFTTMKILFFERCRYVENISS